MTMMYYNNDDMLRQDRVLSEGKAYDLLRIAEYATLSMIDADGLPYAVPISFAFDGKASLYLHGARMGKKLTCIQQNNNVCCSIVGATLVQSDKFTSLFESLVLQAKAFVVTDDEERMQAMRLLLQKYSPQHVEKGIAFAANYMHETGVMRLDIVKMSGKSKQ
jgi:nitroimidazol reductase NimA-like FMN-containing flavoprotein (pyridoxamine 5'-phosphate oxidase superfamily)